MSDKAHCKSGIEENIINTGGYADKFNTKELRHTVLIQRCIKLLVFRRGISAASSVPGTSWHFGNNTRERME